MHSNPAEIGERIKAARKAAHLSQTELAQRLDKTMRTVQKYESGEIEPSIAMINAIAKILDISPADLIGYQKPEIQLDSLSDVIAVLYQLNKKTGIRFEIDVQRPPRSEEWSCSLKFKGNDHSAEMNDSLCLILEEFRDERESWKPIGPIRNPLTAGLKKNWPTTQMPSCRIRKWKSSPIWSAFSGATNWIGRCWRK